MQNTQEPPVTPQPLAPPGYALLRPDPAGHGASESAELFDWALIGSYLMFVLHSIRRHKRLFLLVWIGIVAFSFGLMVSLPKTYQVRTTLQAQRNQVMSALSNPGRTIPVDADAPTRLAAETVQRYDNLVALIQQTEMVKTFALHRAPLVRLKEWIWRVLFRPPTPEEQIDNLVYYLRDRLWVQTGEGTVTIGIEFPNAQLAYRLVETAQQNFLEARHAADVSSITEAITILEGRAEQSHQALTATLQQLQVLRDARAARLGGRRVSRAADARVTASIDQETARLLVAVQSKRRAIADLEEFRRRRVAELQTRLQEVRANFSENHPAVLDTQQSLYALRQDSPQVTALKRELAPQEAELKKRGVIEQTTQEVGRSAPIGMQPDVDPREDEDSQIGYAKEQVTFALTTYNSFLDRIEAARLELESARAAFKYRYTVILPAQRPRGPIKPKPPLVLGASLIAGFALALLSATLLDMHSRKLLENWQVERTLKLPLIGEVRSK
jgi:hypothetical protein